MGQPAQDAKQRIQWIDAARGFAMVLVVLGHIAQKYYRQDISATYTYIVYKVIYSFHIPLFMMISGYMLHRVYVDQNGEIKGSRLKTQFLNILLIYVVFSIFEGILKIFISADGVDNTSVKNVLLFWMKPIGGRLWYLYVLMEYYVIFSRRWIIRNIDKIWVIVLVGLLSAGSAVFPSGWVFCIKIAATNILPFYIGILLSRFGVDSAKRILWAILSLAVVVGRIWFYCRGVVENEIPILSILYGVVLSVAILLLFRGISGLQKNRVLQGIGSNTMEIFIMHEYPLIIGAKIIKRYVSNVWISMILCLVLTVSATFGVNELLKRCRIHDMIFRPYKRRAGKTSGCNTAGDDRAE